MSEIDKKLEVINNGRMAVLASDHIGALISQMKNKKISEMAANFRIGKVDQATLISGIAGFCALEDLELDMKRKIIKGQQVSHEMNKEQMNAT